MNELCVTLTATAISLGCLGAGDASACEANAGKAILDDSLKASGSLDVGFMAIPPTVPDGADDGLPAVHGVTGDRPIGDMVADNQKGRRVFMWPWAVPSTQSDATRMRSNQSQINRGNRGGGGSGSNSRGSNNGGNSGGGTSGSSNSSGSSGGNMGGGSSSGGTGSSGGGNMGGGGSGGSSSGNM